MLTGSALIDALKAADPALGQDERIRLAGYTFEREGRERLNRAGFHKALAQAVAPNLAGPVESEHQQAPRGRSLTYRASVLAAGHAVVGRCYLQQIGVQPGDQLAIATDQDSITLRKAV